MNFPKLKRRIIHIFCLLALSLLVASPVLAVTVDVVTPNQTIEAIPLEKPLALKTPTPSREDAAEAKSAEQTTPTPTTEPTPTSKPTETPTPTPTLEPTAQPTQPLQATGNVSTGGLNADVLFSMSNNYRAGLGLPPFQTDPRICSLAAMRAPEISAEISGGYMHAGKDRHNFPFWFTENIITMRTEAEAFNWWVNDHIHRVQIEAPNTHSCVACSGNACVQHFTSFKPK